MDRPTHELNRRNALKTLGGAAAGFAGVLSGGAATTSAEPTDGRHRIGFRPATIERPTNDARCWFQNATDRAVDVYVNYHDQAYLTMNPVEDGPVFSIDSDASRIYGTYTFEVREKDNPDGEVLASVSVLFQEGDSYTGVFHRVGDTDYQFSIYENDFSPTGDTRFEIRHNALPETIDWRLFTAEHADPSIPEDERSGTLERGQWQQAIDVTENEYRLEVLVDGKVVAYRQDLGLEANRMIVCYVVGDPKWWMGSDQKESHIRRDEFQIQTGEHREDRVTPPAEPYTTTDDNRTIQFEFDPVVMYETNWAEAEIEATDPDGIVNDIKVDSVEPYSDGFKIPDETVDRAYFIGGTTDGTLEIRPKVPPADYDVELLANPTSLGEKVTATLPVEVKKVTVERLQDLVTRYHDSGDITDEFAADLHGYLDDAAAYLDAGETGEACAPLKRVIDLVGEYKNEGVSGTASDDITAETRALRYRLGCG